MCQEPRSPSPPLPLSGSQGAEEACTNEGPCTEICRKKKKKRPGQRTTACRLIFRGDPCVILGSDIISVSVLAPRYPSEMKNLDAVPYNSALNPRHWDFSIMAQMEWMPLHAAKAASLLFILPNNVSCLSELKKNKNGHVFVGFL